MASSWPTISVSVLVTHLPRLTPDQDHTPFLVTHLYVLRLLSQKVIHTYPALFPCSLCPPPIPAAVPCVTLLSAQGSWMQGEEALDGRKKTHLLFYTYTVGGRSGKVSTSCSCVDMMPLLCSLVCRHLLGTVSMSEEAVGFHLA